MEINFKELTLKGDRPLVFILSGAGLSAESGIPTFRDANPNSREIARDYF